MQSCRVSRCSPLLPCGTQVRVTTPRVGVAPLGLRARQGKSGAWLQWWASRCIALSVASSVAPSITPVRPMLALELRFLQLSSHRPRRSARRCCGGCALDDSHGGSIRRLLARDQDSCGGEHTGGGAVRQHEGCTCVATALGVTEVAPGSRRCIAMARGGDS